MERCRLLLLNHTTICRAVRTRWLGFRSTRPSGCLGCGSLAHRAASSAGRHHTRRCSGAHSRDTGVLRWLRWLERWRPTTHWLLCFLGGANAPTTEVRRAPSPSPKSASSFNPMDPCELAARETLPALLGPRHCVCNLARLALAALVLTCSQPQRRQRDIFIVTTCSVNPLNRSSRAGRNSYCTVRTAVG